MSSTYFITTQTFNRKRLFQNALFADLFIEILIRYRDQHKFLLHEFVVMPDHIHLLITPYPGTTMERSIQFVKGGFSRELTKRFGYAGEVWQTSFQDRRVRDHQECSGIVRYIRANPVQAHLANDYPFSSATVTQSLDPLPQGLKPTHSDVLAQA